MHGRHHTSVATTLGRGASGPRVSGAVRRSLVAPKTATTGAPTAAARCMAPESLETTPSAPAMTLASSPRVVRPQRSTTPSSAPGRRRLTVRVISAAGVLIAAAADERDRMRLGDEPGGQLAESHRRPLLGLAVCRARCEHHVRTAWGRTRVEPRRVHARMTRAIGDAEGADERLVVRRLALGRPGPRGGLREQAPSQVGGQPPPLTDTGPMSDERRREGIRQQQRGVEARGRQGVRIRAPGPQRGQAAAPRQRQDGIDARHHREQRRNRASAGDRQVGVGKMTTDVRDRGKRHHRVTQPVGCEHDQTSWAAGHGCAAGNMPVVTGAGASRHRRCIHSQSSGCRRTYISSTSVQRCVNSRTASGPSPDGGSTGAS